MLRSPALLMVMMIHLAAVGGNTARAEVKVRFETRAEKDSTRKRPMMVVDNGEMMVEFTRETFWTVRDIFYKGAMVGQPSGGTGAVIYWDGKPVGTVHREGGHEEKLRSVDLILDGKTIPLWAEGKETFTEAAAYEGKDFELVKRSMIGPLLHEAHFTWKGGTNLLRAKNSFEAMEDAPKERFEGRYVFMHMMPLVMTEWMRVNPDGTVAAGTVASEQPDKGRVVWKELGRGMASYGPENQTGIAYFFPAGATGLCEYSFRGGKDTKFRAALFDQNHYVKGDKRSWTLLLEPFTAAPEGWVKVAEGLINGN